MDAAMRHLAGVVVSAAILVGCSGRSTAPDVSLTPIEGASCVGDAGQYYTCPGDDTNVCPAWPSCYWQCTSGHWTSSMTYDGAVPNFDHCPRGDIWQWRGCDCFNNTTVDSTCSGFTDGGCPVTCSCRVTSGWPDTVTCVLDRDAGAACPRWP